jgi:predicted Zn-dependent peptidase
VEHQAADASFLVEADVATEVTGPALMETLYELGRMALTPVTEAELDAARRYVLGSMALSTATHAGLASTLSALVGAGLPADWLAGHQQALGAVTVEQAQEASRRYLAPGALTAVVVGDAGEVEAQLAALGPLTVRQDTGA